MSKSTSSVVAEYQLRTDFHEVRRTLLAGACPDRLQKPLAHWALAADRHLPLALLGQTLEQLLSTPFERLLATPGVGPKKLRSMIVLFERAARPAPEIAGQTECRCGEPAADLPATDSADLSATVNEEVWEQWRSSIRAYGLAHETLGRFAPTLQALPRATWSTPLERYLDQNLAEIRELRAHGAKRVQVVLEIMSQLYAMIAQGSHRPDLVLRIVPRFVEQIERWATGRLREGLPIARDELLASVVSPLVEQIRIDGGDQAALVVESRLAAPALSAVQAAKRLGLHRSHFYDRLSQVAAIFAVRWPEGHAWTDWFRERLANGSGHDTAPAAAPALGLFDAAVRIFFPTDVPRPQAEGCAPLDLTWRSFSASGSPL
jgi:hypothetical protein